MITSIMMHVQIHVLKYNVFEYQKEYHLSTLNGRVPNKWILFRNEKTLHNKAICKYKKKYRL